MKHVRARLIGALVIAVPLAIILGTGCASVPKVESYDGYEIVPTASADTLTVVPIVVRNNRSQDAIDPTFYLIGYGRHALGTVRGLTTRKLLIDRRWIPSDGIMTVVAHYPGGPEWVSEKITWRPGYKIEVSLQSLINTSSAWAHR